MYVGISVKQLFFWSDVNDTFIFSTDFRKILKYKKMYIGIRVKQLFILIRF